MYLKRFPERDDELMRAPFSKIEMEFIACTLILFLAISVSANIWLWFRLCEMREQHKSFIGELQR